MISHILRQFICLNLFGIGLMSTANATESVILYGDDNYAPYSYVEDGHFKGMYIDILTAAAKKLAPEYVIELRPIPWKRGLADLEIGNAFGLFPPGLKLERNYIQPYSIVLYRETVVLFCNDKIMQTPRKVFPDNFIGLTIGVNAGFLLSDRLMQAAKQDLVKLDPAKGNETNIEKLALNRIDCYASDRAAALYSAKHLPSSFSQGVVTLKEAVELSGEDTFIAYSAKNNPAYKSDFVAKMNAVLGSMKKSGETTRIENAYLR
jgi:polar amino acid transport system substrate-binding protein